MKNDTFFQQVKNFQTLEGSTKVPILYKKVTCIGAFFSVPKEKIKRLLPTDKLKPVSIGGGRASYGILCFEYHDTTIGPYNEVGFGIPCLYNPLIDIPVLPAIFDRKFSVGSYVHHLPVTTRIANDLGVKFWGFPKFMAKIDFEDSKDIRKCIIRADDKEIAALAIRKGENLKPYRWDITNFTVKNNMLIKTVANSQGKLWTSRKTDSATLTLGDHSVSEELRSLKLDLTPHKTMFYADVQMILNMPSERYPL